MNDFASLTRGQKRSFEQGVRELVNTLSIENVSDTPDYVMAEYLFDCMAAYHKAVVERAEHSKTRPLGKSG